VQAGFSHRSIGAGKEELLDYYNSQFCYKGTIEVPLGEEGFREIAITLIIKAPISWFGFLDSLSGGGWIRFIKKTSRPHNLSHRKSRGRTGWYLQNSL